MIRGAKMCIEVTFSGSLSMYPFRDDENIFTTFILFGLSLANAFIPLGIKLLTCNIYSILSHKPYVSIKISNTLFYSTFQLLRKPSSE